MHRRTMLPALTLTAAVIVLAAIGGCNDGAAQVAREAADRQAEQNRTMAELQREVAAGSRRLVEDEGVARADALKLHQDFQAERTTLAAGWNDLETERQTIARQRRADSFWTAMLPIGGGALAAGLALAFAWLALFGLHRGDDSAGLACQLLVEQLMTHEGTAFLATTASLDQRRDNRVAGLLRESDPHAQPENP